MRQFDSDKLLDEWLRDVPVPGGLVARLREIVDSPDDSLDEPQPERQAEEGNLDLRLQDVVIREDFLQSLREIPARSKKRRKLAVAVPLEETLCEVPLPRGFMARLRQIARPERLSSLATPWAAAAAILIMALVAGIGVLIGRATIDVPQVAEQSADEAWLDSVLAHDEPQSLEPALVTETVADVALEQETFSDIDRWLAVEQSAPVTELVEAPTASSLDRMRLVGPDARKLMSDVYLASLGGVLANPNSAFDDRPDLSTLPGLRPRGIDPPTNPEFDLLFYRKHGVQPFVGPSWLPEMSVPLAGCADSYELARRCLAAGELPQADAVRTEEFLVAPNYRYRWPEPVGEPLSIQTAAGPSPLARADNAAPLAMPLEMLHVGVQARQLSNASRQPADVTVVVDLSGSMRWGGRLDMVRAALHEQIGRMQVGDRWNLVAFSEQAWVVAEDLSRDQAGQLHEAVESLYARTSTNVGAGLELARLLNEDRRVEAGRTRHVVLLSDGLSLLDVASYDLLRDRFRRQEPGDLRLTLVALGLEHVADTQWTALARETDQRFARAGSAAEIDWAMSEAIDERSSVVAQAVTMRVVFDPQQVESYRLLGHESFAVAGLMPVAGEVEFRSGQTGVALFELKLREPAKPEAGKPEAGKSTQTLRTTDAARTDVARVIVEWRDPSGTMRSIRQPVRRRQFAPTFAESGPALQRAVLAAAAAEVLRGSYFVRGVKMNDVAALVDQLPPAVAAEPDVEQLVKLIRAAARLQR